MPTDVVSRYKRMNGYNVLHPMGWDAFGLPAENYALKKGVHPRMTTEENIATYKRQMDLIGLSYDWSREISSIDPDYYRWTQWFFLLMYERGLAYRATGQQWWCPSCKTILANEQVEQGKCWRCGSDGDQGRPGAVVPPHHRLRPAAARRSGHASTGRRRSSSCRRNWIGRSEGAEVEFAIAAGGGAAGESITVFTTRPDTLFGATYMVLAPEHPLVDVLTTPEHRAAVAAYQERARRESEIERLSTEREKTGVFIGAYAVNPVNDERIPIWISDYVLMGYGTGAIMAVPGHDERDFAFATKFDLPIVEVIAPPAEDGAAAAPQGVLSEAFAGDGFMVNSGRFDGLAAPGEAFAAVVDWLGERGLARRKVNYKLRDWLISRQRYWGVPIPVVYCDELRRRAGPHGRAAGAAAGHRRLRAHRRRSVAAGPGRGLGAHHLSGLRRAGASRDRHHGHVHVLVVVPLPLPVAAVRQGGLRSRGGGLLAAGRHVRGRRRARGDAPALRPLLLQGPLRRRARSASRSPTPCCATRA